MPRSRNPYTGTPAYCWVEHVAGWPWLCLRWQITPNGKLRNAFLAPQWVTLLFPTGPYNSPPMGWGDAWVVGNRYQLPYDIVWRGFIFDAIIFAFAWTALIAGAWCGRRAVRRGARALSDLQL